MTLLSVCSQTSFIKRRRFQALPGTSSTCLRLFMSPGGFLPASYQGQQPGPQVWPPRPLFWKWSCGVKPETDLSRVIWAYVASVRNLLQCLLQSKEEGWSCDFFKGKKKKKKEDGLNQESSLLPSDSSDGKCQLQTAYCFSVVAVMVALWTRTSFRFLLKPPKVFSTFFFQQ